ncbi:FMN-binding protein [Austwickia chelonae]|uniref:FMN-binding protein n=1 Tax=Austwickia chelonae TaxID=100225 RepID=UPI000E2786F9|nr:FMN-binding protein [Austwickia chelonae]
MNPTRAMSVSFAVGAGVVVVLCAGCAQPPDSRGGAPSTSTTVAPSTASAVPCQPNPSYRDGQYSGERADYKYGDTTVKITVAGGCITQVEAALNANSSYSTQLQGKAGPVLKDRVVAANSAEISTVSGATYTSQAYRTSLQAAVDQARQAGASGSGP